MSDEAQYEIEVSIRAARDRVWRALFDEIDAWWLPDFHMTGAGSRMEFQACAGGGLIERHENGGSLLWCTVHWVQPDAFTVYLVGHLAPDWGGPTTSMIRIRIDEHASGAKIHFRESHVGHIDQENLGSLREGWTALLTDGLKKHIERPA